MKMWRGLLAVVILASVWSGNSRAAITSLEEENSRVDEKTVVITSAPEPLPVMKYRLFTDSFDLTDENAAIYYARAIYFMMEYPVQKRLEELTKKWKEKHGVEDAAEEPPGVWTKLSPDDLPVADVKEFLSLFRLQEEPLRKASYCRRCDFKRNVKTAESPLTVLLVEVHEMRKIARWHIVRFKLAVREKRYEDAIRYLRELFMMAHHFGQQETLVENLVGVAICRMAVQCSYDLAEEAGMPNLYWAFEVRPQPFFDFRNSISVESRMLFLELRFLNEVDEVPLPESFWIEHAPELQKLSAMHTCESYPACNTSSQVRCEELLGRAFLGTFLLMRSYGPSRKYLKQVWHMSEEKLNELSVLQTVLLAERRIWEQTSQEVFARFHLPPWQLAEDDLDVEAIVNKFPKDTGLLTYVLFPALDVVYREKWDVERELRIRQLVGSLREFAAREKRLPRSLTELRLPAPADPLTNTPFRYRVEKDKAVLEGNTSPWEIRRIRLTIRLANDSGAE